MVEGELAERLVYKMLNELHNLHKNKENMSQSEYSTGVRNVITKLKRKNENDVLEEVKEKVDNLTKRFEDRIVIEEEKKEQIEEQSKNMNQRFFTFKSKYILKICNFL